ncbi:glycosyltransferase family 4 protein [Phocaeicola sp. KGMB11183]|uniref:Glycosyltransferase family 4 protein n=1 Tax=Phocaeicola acetigenes TaxID=3016083 RepID=A0ABT4PK44_9BACT|nr:glycosyltransferase family 4 protein [Phocaeicola sp. KGMB11183]MCZ8373415.1 glycosyltransferase family 4 protein [Phocaeicola sp. KGMB11183]
MKKIKICFVETNCKKNGPIKQTLNIIRYMDRSIFEPILLTLWKEEQSNSMISEYKKQNIQIVCANLTKYTTFIIGRKKVTELLKQLKPDIVQGVGMPPYRTTLGYKKTIHFITLRNYCYEDYPDYYGKIKGQIMAYLDMRLIRKKIQNEPIITCSSSLTYLYKTKQKLDIPFIRNGVNVEQYKKRNINEVSHIRTQLGLPLEKIIFVYGGFFIDRKNQQECIEGFLKSESNSNCILLLLGDGKERKELASKYKNYPQIIFAGQVDNIQNYLSASDIYISSSKSEGLPNGVLEAMACGLPLLLSDIPQHMEIFSINSSIGYSYQLGNIKDLSKKINLILNNNLTEMGEVSYNTLKENLTAEIMSKNYQKLYKQLVQIN